jgi:Protein of unknown function (DUF3667)
MADEIDAISELSAAAAAELAASALASRGAKAQSCSNCGAPLIGPYCAACGQPHDSYRKSIWRLMWETLEHIVNLDSRLMRTAYALMLEPGELPLAFKANQTQRYVPAPRLYLFVSLLFFLILAISGIALLQFEVNLSNNTVVSMPENGMAIFIGPKSHAPEIMEIQRKAAIGKLTQTDIEKLKTLEGRSPDVSAKARFFSKIGSVQTHIPDEVRKQLAQLKADAAAKPPGVYRWISMHMLQGLEDIAKEPAALNGPLTAWLPRVLFLLLPLFALLLWLFYWRLRKQFLLVDHLVFSLTLHTFAFVILIMAAFAVQVAPADAIGWAALLIVLAYFFVAMKRFYGQNYFWTATKFISVFFLYTIFFLLPALGLVIFAGMVQA